jgi:hypothetical protein
MEGFWRETLERVSQIRGVQVVSLAGTVPLAPGRQRQPWVNATTGEKLEIEPISSALDTSARLTFRLCAAASSTSGMAGRRDWL